MKLSSLDLAMHSPHLREFTETFLPTYAGAVKALARPTTRNGCHPNLSQETLPVCVELFLHQSHLDGPSLQCLLEALVGHGFFPTALHLGTNPKLGQNGMEVVAGLVRRSPVPLRWIALTKSGVTATSVQELIRAVLERGDLYKQQPCPFWIDLGGGVHEDELAKVFQYLDSLEPGLYCRALNRSSCGLTRCAKPGVTFHFPRVGVTNACGTGVGATSNEGSSRRLSLHASPDCGGTVDPPEDEERLSAVSSDNADQMSEISSDEEEASVSLRSPLPAAAIPEAAHAMVPAAPSETLLITSSTVHEVLQYAYHALLRDTFLSMALIAAGRDIIPIDFLRDLHAVFLEGTPIEAVPLPPLWGLHTPASVATKLLAQEEEAVEEDATTITLRPDRKRRRREIAAVQDTTAAATGPERATGSEGANIEEEKVLTLREGEQQLPPTPSAAASLQYVPSSSMAPASSKEAPPHDSSDKSDDENSVLRHPPRSYGTPSRSERLGRVDIEEGEIMTDAGEADIDHEDSAAIASRSRRRRRATAAKSRPRRRCSTSSSGSSGTG